MRQGSLIDPPRYPGHGQADDARRWLAWKMGLDLFGAGFYANPNEVLRAAIENYGVSVIAGKAPNGRVETLSQLYERTLGPFRKESAPKAKTPRPRRRLG